MIRSEIVSADLGHVRHVALNMRDADVDEILAMGSQPVAGVMASYKASMFTWAWLVEGEALTVFGVCCKSFTSDEGVPWMITTPMVLERQIQFLRFSRRVLNEHLGMYRYLENVVDDRHVVAKKWLEWLGFSLGEPMPYGPQGLPFRKFELRREHVR